MRRAWLSLAALLGCAAGEDVDEPPKPGTGGAGGVSMGGAAGGAGWPVGGGGTNSGGIDAGGASGGGTGGAAACSVQGCHDAASTGAGCAQARVIGRVSAGSASGYTVTDTTCNASNAGSGFGSACADAGNDHTYRIFLRAGENITVTLAPGAKCATAASWERTFKIYSGTGCSDTGCSTPTFCYTPGAAAYTKGLNVTSDGWYTLVVDGATASDSGSYTLTVKLACKTPGCEC